MYATNNVRACPNEPLLLLINLISFADYPCRRSLSVVLQVNDTAIFRGTLGNETFKADFEFDASRVENTGDVCGAALMVDIFSESHYKASYYYLAATDRKSTACDRQA